MVTQKNQRALMGIMGGGNKTPLSAVRQCGMEVPPSEALDTNGSLHLTMGYLLRDECGGLRVLELIG